jgi:hypothetical protein
MKGALVEHGSEVVSLGEERVGSGVAFALDVGNVAAMKRWCCPLLARNGQDRALRIREGYRG